MLIKRVLVINYISREYIDLLSDMLKNNQGDQISTVGV